MKSTLLLAYLDPGTGSIIIQAVVGGVLGGMLVIKLFWKKIVSFFVTVHGVSLLAFPPAACGTA